jgi:radical SAM superfamily enzyme YgiQ (UPF0313 family)
VSEHISFACLKHDQHSCNNIAFGLACVASYAIKEFGDRINVKLSQFPEDLKSQLENKIPRVLCFTNYCWNLNISCEFAKRVKQKSPETIIIFGGPNYPLLQSDQKEFLKAHPEIDFYVFRDGELAFTDLLKVLFENNFDSEKIKKNRQKITQTHYLIENEMVCGEIGPSIMDLDEIPSPYLSGLCDDLLAQNLIPNIQTKRGCPFQCTFCEDGHSYHNKIRRFSFDRVKDELWYIAARTKAPHVMIADLNFGMYAEDVDVANELALLQKKFGWPKFFGNLNGKNNKERVVHIASIINQTNYSAAIQSTDQKVLKSIKRSNISKEKMLETTREAQKLGASSVSELILCLPEDSLQAHLRSNFDLMDAEIETIRTHQTVMLPGAEMSSKAERARFGTKTRFRVMPQTISSYNIFGEDFWCPEIDEICVANNTMPIEDYFEARCFNLTVEIFYNAAVCSELIKFLKFHQINASSFIHKVHLYLNENKTKFLIIYEGFLRDNKEIWESEQEIKNFLRQPGTQQLYQEGKLGNNEQLKYRAISLLENMESIHEVAFKVAKKIMSDEELLNDQLEEYLDELADFSLSRKINLLSLDSVVEKKFHYDFIELMSKNFDGDPTQHYRPTKNTFEIRHTESQRELISEYVKIFGSSYYGFGTMLSQSPASSFFREARLSDSLQLA